MENRTQEDQREVRPQGDVKGKVKCRLMQNYFQEVCELCYERKNNTSADKSPVDSILNVVSWSI